jgi:TonB-dependent receptor
MQTFYNYSYNLRSLCKHAFLLLFVLGFSTIINAQEDGRITGTVTDKSSGDPLPGANVFLEGTSLGSATTNEGKYIIRQVTPGNYNMIIRYIGYQEHKMPITVQSGKTLEVDVELEIVTIEGGEVIVTAQAMGQTEAINQQLSSNTISNVVSSARIQDIPDANAAESVGRLPGISIKRSGGEGQKVTIRGMSPKYNVMGVNGVRMQSSDPEDRSVDLNMIAPNALSGIEVKKALTADMDADAVGGTVDLKISKARDGFQKSISIQNGYASLSNDNKFGNIKLSGSVSDRFFDNKLGVQATGNYQAYDRSSDDLYGTFGWHGIDTTLNNYWMEDIQIRDYTTERKRFGGSLVLDYQLSNGFFMYTGFIGRLNNHSIVQQNQFGADDRAWSGYAADSLSKTTVFQNALQGEFDFDIIKIDFSVSHALTQMRLPSQIYMSMGPYNGGSLLQGWSIPASSTIQYSDVVHMTPVDFINAVDVSTFRGIKWLRTLKRDNDISAISGALNFEVPYNFSDYLAGNLKFGGKVVRNTRKNDETRWSIDAATGINVAAFESALKTLWTSYTGYELLDPNGIGIGASDRGTRAQLFVDPNYGVGDFLSGLNVKNNIFTNLINISRMHDLEDFVKNHTITTASITGQGTVTNPMYQEDPRESFDQDYNYTRDYMAFYLMTTLNIGKYITFIPGIRYEKYNFDYTAYNIFVTGAAQYPGDQTYYTYKKVNWDSTKSDNWFPQIQLKIKPVDWFDIRLAITKSIIYPDYRAVSPYLYSNTFQEPFLNLGNPYLKPATTQNYDVYASIYDNHIGLFTAGYFYKKIDDLIVPISYKTKDASVINNRFDLTQSALTSIDTWTNLTDPSYVDGFELDWQTHFWYLPSPLTGLVFNINYTKVYSESYYNYIRVKKTGNPPFYKYEYVDTTRTGRLVDQPDDILNLTLGYDYGGFSARLSYLYQNDVLEEADNQYSALDEHTKPYSRWDFTAYQKLPWVEGLQLFLNINNITNEADLRYRNMNIDKYLSRAEYYGTTGELGIRYSP